MPVILDQGKTAIRNAIKTLVTHILVSNDTTVWAAGQSAINPDSTKNFHAEVVTETDNNGYTTTFSCVIDGNSEFTNKTIYSLGLASGSARTDVISRQVRTQGIGVEAGDQHTIEIQVVVQDNS